MKQCCLSLGGLSRRSFIQTAASGLLAAKVLTRSPLLGAAADKAPWPVACRDTHLRATGRPDCWSAAKALGLQGLEVTVNENLSCPNLFHPEKQYRLEPADNLALLRADLEQNGLAISAFCMNNQFDARLDQELAWTKNLVRVAQKLDLKAIRIDVVPTRTPVDQFLSFAVRACKRLCEIVSGTAIHFGIENHGRVTNDPAFLETLFHEVNSPQLGLTLDACNFYWFGHPLPDVYRLCEQFAARTVHTHCKNICYPENRRTERRPIGWEYEKYACPLPAGDLDYARIAAALRQANYQGHLCLENECLRQFPADQHLEILKKEIYFLKSL
jgi:sugar phosphate isomerase/epimerase